MSESNRKKFTITSRKMRRQMKMFAALSIVIQSASLGVLLVSGQQQQEQQLFQSANQSHHHIADSNNNLAQPLTTINVGSSSSVPTATTARAIESTEFSELTERQSPSLTILATSKSPTVNFGATFPNHQDLPPYFYNHPPEGDGGDEHKVAPAAGEGREVDHSGGGNDDDLDFNLMNAPHEKIQAMKHLLNSQQSMLAQQHAAELGTAMQCTHKGRQFLHGQTVPIEEQPCLNCTCVRAILQCYLRVCPPIVSLEAHHKKMMQEINSRRNENSAAEPQRCRMQKEQNQCCPVMKCEPLAASASVVDHQQGASTTTTTTTTTITNNQSMNPSQGAAPVSTTMNTTTLVAQQASGYLLTNNNANQPASDTNVVSADVMSATNSEIGDFRNQQQEESTRSVAASNDDSGGGGGGANAIELRMQQQQQQQPSSSSSSFVPASNRSVNDVQLQQLTTLIGNASSQNLPSYQSSNKQHLPKLTVINGANGQRDSILLITSNPHTSLHHNQNHHSIAAAAAGSDKLNSAASELLTTTFMSNGTNQNQNNKQHDYSNTLLEVLLETVYSSASQLNGLNLQGSCMINGSFYVEGSAVLPENNNAYCQYCYCIRQKIMCVKPKCHLSISGCTPKYSNEFACCPTSYNCASSSPSSSAAIQFKQGGDGDGVTQTNTNAQNLSAKLSAAIESISRLSQSSAASAANTDHRSSSTAAHQSNNSETLVGLRSLNQSDLNQQPPATSHALPIAVMALMNAVGLPINGSTGSNGVQTTTTTTTTTTLSTATAAPMMRQQQQQRGTTNNKEREADFLEFNDEEGDSFRDGERINEMKRRANASSFANAGIAGTGTGSTTERPSSVSDFLEPMNKLGPLVMLPTVPTGCVENGRQYAIGEQIPTLESCKHCYCGLEGLKECKMIECSLKISHNCRPITPEGHCCPIRYECPQRLAPNGGGINAAANQQAAHQKAVGSQAREAIQRYRSETSSSSSSREGANNTSFAFRDISQCRNGTNECSNQTAASSFSSNKNNNSFSMVENIRGLSGVGVNDNDNDDDDDDDNAPVVKTTRIIDDEDDINRRLGAATVRPKPVQTENVTNTFVQGPQVDNGTPENSGNSSRNDSSTTPAAALTEELNKFIMQINHHHNNSSFQGTEYSMAGNLNQQANGSSITTLAPTQEMMINDQHSRMVADYHSVQAQPALMPSSSLAHDSPIPNGMVGIPSIEPESIKNLVETNRLALANGEILPIEPSGFDRQPATVGNGADPTNIFVPPMSLSGQRDSRSTNAHKLVDHAMINNDHHRSSGFPSGPLLSPSLVVDEDNDGGNDEDDQNNNNSKEPHVFLGLTNLTIPADQFNTVGGDQQQQQQQSQPQPQPPNAELRGANISDIDYIDATDGLTTPNSGRAVGSSWPARRISAGSLKNLTFQAINASIRATVNPMVVFDDDNNNNNETNSNRTSTAINGGELLAYRLPEGSPTSSTEQPPPANTTPQQEVDPATSTSTSSTPFPPQPTTGTPIGLDTDRTPETSGWLRSLSGFVHSFGRRLQTNNVGTGVGGPQSTSRQGSELQVDSSSSTNEQPAALVREASLVEQPITGRSIREEQTSILNQLINRFIGPTESHYNEQSPPPPPPKQLVIRPLASVRQVDSLTKPRDHHQATTRLEQLSPSLTSNTVRARAIFSPYEPSSISSSPSEIEIVTAAAPNDPEFFSDRLNDHYNAQNNNDKMKNPNEEFSKRTDLSSEEEQQQHSPLVITTTNVNNFRTQQQVGGNQQHSTASVIKYHPPTINLMAAKNQQQQQQQQKSAALNCFDLATNRTYQANEIIPKDDPCKTCTCILGEEMCQTLVCPEKPAENCSEERRPGECCANYLCGTQFTGNNRASNNVVQANSAIRSNIGALSARLMMTPPISILPPVPQANQAGRTQIGSVGSTQRIMQIEPSSGPIGTDGAAEQVAYKPAVQQQQVVMKHQQQLANQFQGPNLAGQPQINTIQQTQSNSERARSIPMSMMMDSGNQVTRQPQQPQQQQQLPQHPIRTTNDLANLLPPHLRFRPNFPVNNNNNYHFGFNNNNNQNANAGSNSHHLQGYIQHQAIDQSKILFAGSPQQQANTQRFPSLNNVVINQQQQQQQRPNNNQMPTQWRSDSAAVIENNNNNNNNGANNRFVAFNSNQANSMNHHFNRQQMSTNSVVQPSILPHPQRSPNLILPLSTNGLPIEKPAATRRFSQSEDSSSFNQQQQQQQPSSSNWKLSQNPSKPADATTNQHVNFIHQQMSGGIIPPNVLTSRMSQAPQLFVQGQQPTGVTNNNNNNLNQQPAVATTSTSLPPPALFLKNSFDVNSLSSSALSIGGGSKQLPYELNEVIDKKERVVFNQQQQNQPDSLYGGFNLLPNSATDGSGFKPIPAPVPQQQQQQQKQATTIDSGITTTTNLTTFQHGGGSLRQLQEDSTTTRPVDTPTRSNIASEQPEFSLSSSIVKSKDDNILYFSPSHQQQQQQSSTTMLPSSIATWITTTTTTRANDIDEQQKSSSSIMPSTTTTTATTTFNSSIPTNNNNDVLKQTTAAATTTSGEATSVADTRTGGDQVSSSVTTEITKSDQQPVMITTSESTPLSETPSSSTSSAETTPAQDSLYSSPSPSSTPSPDQELSSSTESTPFDPLSMFRVSECNIYGRLYQVGQTINELSDVCKSCMCTSMGVDCQNKCR